MSDSGPRRITADDIYGFRLLNEPRFSPDGKSVAYVVTTIERENNDYRSSVYVTSADGAKTRRLTRADAKDTAPRWSPDGSQIAFLSNRDDKAQIWAIRADGGEAWRVSTLDEGVNSFAWSPDGKNFVAVSKSVEGEPGDVHEDGTEKKSDEYVSDVRHIKKIRYKADGEGFLDFKPKHLWLIPASGDGAHQLTSADVDDADPVWSPNGQEIAFVTNRTDGREMNSVSEIWAIHAHGKQERRVVGGDSARFHSPSWSPDGTKIAIVGNWHAEAGGSRNVELWSVPAGGGDPESLSEGFDRSISDSAMSDIYAASTTRPIWQPNGERILALVSSDGSTQIVSISVTEGSVEQITQGNRRVSAFDVSDDGQKMVYVSATTTNPGDLFIANLDGSDEQQLTSLNADMLGGITLSQPEEFWVESKDGNKVQCWVMKPVGFDASRKYPMILEIHGGPHGMYSNSFMHEFQLMAARGYVVVYTNPRGSAGYGEAYTTSTRMAWGEVDMPDLMAAVDWVVEQGYVDPNRLGVTGGSYGGYMTLWVIGHTDRFKAAVTQRCVSNLHSFYGTSDIGFTFGEYEFGGTAWEQREHFMKYSPITYVADMRTPLLIVHSEEDYRCPIEQGEQVFISLKRLGREVEFVRFPNENHNLSRTGKPKHRIERLEHIIGWFDSHL
jgi:dipeptidyl aminopeptidase/acylaminoacyl peptidase